MYLPNNISEVKKGDARQKKSHPDITKEALQSATSPRPKEIHSKKLTALEKDRLKEIQLSQNLKGWHNMPLFLKSFLNAMGPAQKQIALTQTSHDKLPYKRVDRSFYKFGHIRYKKHDIVLDYTPLLAKGITTIWEMTIHTSLTSSNLFSNHPVPYYFCAIPPPIHQRTFCE